MSLNEFVLAFVGVVIGLGITDLLTSFHKLLRAGSRVKWDWLTLAYAGLMLYSLIVFWWWQFGYPGSQTLTIAQFMPNFAFLAISFLMVAAALPDELPAEGPIDLRDFYLGSLRHRWGLVATGLILTIVINLGLYLRIGSWSQAAWNLLPIISAVLALFAIRVRASWFQALAIVWIFGVTSFFNLLRPIGP